MNKFHQNVTVNSINTAEQSPNCVQYIAFRMLSSFSLISLKDRWKTTLLEIMAMVFVTQNVFYTHAWYNPFFPVFEISWSDTKHKFLGEIFKITSSLKPCHVYWPRDLWVKRHNADGHQCVLFTVLFFQLPSL